MACLRERFGIEKEEIQSQPAPPPSLSIPVEETPRKAEEEVKEECASSASTSSRKSSRREGSYDSTSSSSSSSSSSRRPSLAYAKSLLQEFREYR